MKRKMLLLVGCVCALCLALTGCGGGADAASNFVGSWKLSAVESSTEPASEEDVAFLEEMGMSCSITLNEDKTASLDLFGDVLNGTWEAKDATNATITAEGESLEMMLADGKLSLDLEGDKMVFVKGKPSPQASDDASSDSKDSNKEGSSATESKPSNATGAVSMNTTLVDDDVCTIVVVDKDVDWADDLGYNLMITNNTDKAIYVSTDWGTFSVGNKMVDPILGETIQPGKHVEAFMYFDGEEINGGIEALVDVEGVITVDDDATYDNLASYKVIF